MPEIGAETVRKVAELAKLKLSDEEVARFTEQLATIVQYIDKLATVETSTVEPMTHPLDLPTPTRVDEVLPSPGAAVMLESAPEQMFESYRVPQVLGGSH